MATGYFTTALRRYGTPTRALPADDYAHNGTRDASKFQQETTAAAATVVLSCPLVRRLLLQLQYVRT
jgi:hypothetical protein